MSTIIITLKDNTTKEIPSHSTAMTLAESISRRLAKEAIAAKVNGKVVDLMSELPPQATVEILTAEDGADALEVLRHTAAHVMAEAVMELFPGTKFGIGPAIKDGFYYDFAVKEPFKPEDLPLIESKMRELAAKKTPLVRHLASRAEALAFFAERNEDFKVELINDLPEDVQISYYESGSFVDLCAGPHLVDTAPIKHFKLLSLAGAYWRGDEKRPMLQRIYGTIFFKQADLDAHLHRLEEAKKRDHRKLGKELDLFSVQDEGPGFPFYHPKGMTVRNILEDFWRKEHRKAGYQEIKTPLILNRSLWERSGHWQHYRENMYFTKIDEFDFAVKPMNCPGAMLVYRNTMHSYKELPIRLCELGLVHRHELSGALHGMARVRAFTQDDSHIFMMPEQIEAEVGRVIALVDKFYTVFGLKYRVELSTRPEKAMGDIAVWRVAETALENVLKHREINYKLNPGDGAFYGPKIDFHIEDSIGRSWQCATIQLDFQMPEKFDLTYIGEDGQRHRPVVVHRVLYGAIERFMAMLIEHYAGAFPLWLAPVQVVVMPITDRARAFAEDVREQLEAADIRVELDGRSEKIGFKIREAQMQKVPYMLVLGDKEVESGEVSLRTREGGDQGSMPIADMLAKLNAQIKAFK
ncbi:MAG: Threonine--tRNA ligase 2 [Firmicutes bacterium]|nr:Threonine--tRNA ligase 2 [Bacillota bacterium]MBT9157827.1 Threonine--tRNA ligase 2 [Bacillota bacterium]